VQKVSIIIPAYNSENFVSKTIYSILHQSFRKFELIFIDDGSTDRTAEICRGFDDERIRYVHQANRGVSSARNTGIELAKGEFIGFIDSDDLWHPDKIAAHVAHLESDPTIGVSYSACRFIDVDGAPIKAGYRPKMRNIGPADVFCRNPISGGSSGFFRRRIFDDIIEPRSGDGHRRYFDEDASAPGFSFAEDHQCWMRMAIHSDLRFEGIDRELTYYRIHDGGQSAMIDKMHQGWASIDALVRRLDPGLHAKHSRLANAYQMRYFARRLIAIGDGNEALAYLRLMHSHSYRPYLHEPIKTVSSLAAALALSMSPTLGKQLISRGEKRGAG